MHRRCPFSAVPLSRHFARRRCHGRDGSRGIVHEEVVAVEPMPGRFLAVERDEAFGPSRRGGEAKDEQGEQRPCDETRPPPELPRFQVHVCFSVNGQRGRCVLNSHQNNSLTGLPCTM